MEAVCKIVGESLRRFESCSSHLVKGTNIKKDSLMKTEINYLRLSTLCSLITTVIMLVGILIVKEQQARHFNELRNTLDSMIKSNDEYLAKHKVK